LLRCAFFSFVRLSGHRIEPPEPSLFFRCRFLKSKGCGP
jgi:hypothetical protein